MLDTSPPPVLGSPQNRGGGPSVEGDQCGRAAIPGGVGRPPGQTLGDRGGREDGGEPPDAASVAGLVCRWRDRGARRPLAPAPHLSPPDGPSGGGATGRAASEPARRVPLVPRDQLGKVAHRPAFGL